MSVNIACYKMVVMAYFKYHFLVSNRRHEILRPPCLLAIDGSDASNQQPTSG